MRGGVLWKIKFKSTRESAIVTKKKFALRKFSRKEGSVLWKIKFDSTREYAVVTKEILTKEILP